MLVIALHGFGTTGDGCDLCQDIVTLAEDNNYVGLAPTYPTNNPHLANMYLFNYVESKLKYYNTDAVFIGANLGGFWARYLAKTFGAHRMILINPTLQPWNSLQKYVGANRNTGSNERFDLSMNDANAHYIYRSDDSEMGMQKVKTSLIAYKDSNQDVIDKFTDVRNVDIHTANDYDGIMNIIKSDLFPDEEEKET